jgi:type II secretory pathway component PulF
MPQFNFKAVDEKGARIRGTRDALDQLELARDLKGEGLTVIDVVEVRSLSSLLLSWDSGSSKAEKFTFTTIRQGLTKKEPGLDELVILTRQISALLAAGIPFTESLRIVLNSLEKRSPLVPILTEIYAMIQQGYRPDEAMKKFSSVFSLHYISLITMGMETGRLPETMGTLSSDLEKENTLRKKIVASLTYPVFVFFITFVLNGIIFLVLFPRIIAILQELHINLPLITRIMMAFAKATTNPYALVITAVIFIFMLIQLRLYINTPVGKYHYDRIKLSLPLIGNINKVIFVEKCTRTMSLLFKYAIPIQESLLIAGKVCANTYLYDSLFHPMLDGIREGKDLEQVMRESHFMPSHVIHLVAAGTASGDLVEPLRQASLLYDVELSNTIQRIVTLIEPMMIILMSAFILVTILSIMLPLYQAIIRMAT